MRAGSYLALDLLLAAVKREEIEPTFFFLSDKDMTLVVLNFFKDYGMHT